MLETLSSLITIPLALADSQIVPGIPGPLNPSSSGGILAFIQNAYLFALGIAGLLAVASIAWGGIQYTISRGNPSQLSDAWDRIVQAFVGVLLLVGAGTILSVVNPGLTSLELPDLQNVNEAKYEALQFGLTPAQINAIEARTDLDGKPVKVDTQCTTIQEDPKSACYVGNFQNGCNWDANIMSRMCKKESGGNPAIVGTCDVCKDGTKISFGLLQIQLLSHGRPGSPIYNDLPKECKNLIGGNLSRTSIYRAENKSGACPYRNCYLNAGREADYQKCVKFITGDLKAHLALSCKIFNARKGSEAKKYCDWPHSYNTCISGKKTC